jgi:tetratricopeptide (TPR) repeat protein
LKLFFRNKKDEPKQKKGSQRGLFILALFFAFVVLFSSSRTLSEFPWNGSPMTWLKARDYYDQAEVLRSRYLLSDAETKYGKAIKIFPSDWRMYLSLGLTLLDNHQNIAAEESLNKSLKLQPKNAYSWYLLSRVLYNQKKYAEAEKAAKKALEFAPGDAASTVQLALILQEEKKPDEAEKVYQSTRSLEKDAAFWFLSGNYHMRMRQLSPPEKQNNDLLQQAEANYRQASNMDQSNAEYWETLGLYMLFCKDDPKSAEFYLNRAAHLNQNDAAYWKNLAEVAQYLKQTDKVEDCYWKVARLEPNNAHNWLSLGMTLFFQKRYKDAEEPLRKGLELDNKDARVWNCYVRSLEEQGKYEKAAKEMVKFLAMPENSKSANGWAYMAALQIRVKDFAGAEQSLAQALSFSKDPAEKTNIETVKQQLKKAREHNSAGASDKSSNPSEARSDKTTLEKRATSVSKTSAAPGRVSKDASSGSNGKPTGNAKPQASN